RLVLFRSDADQGQLFPSVEVGEFPENRDRDGLNDQECAEYPGVQTQATQLADNRRTRGGDDRDVHEAEQEPGQETRQDEGHGSPRRRRLHRDETSAAAANTRALLTVSGASAPTTTKGTNPCPEGHVPGRPRASDRTRHR